MLVCIGCLCLSDITVAEETLNVLLGMSEYIGGLLERRKSSSQDHHTSMGTSSRMLNLEDADSGCLGLCSPNLEPFF